MFKWVSNEDYARFVAATGHMSPRHWIDGKIPVGTESFPVTFVSAFDADAYCKYTGVQLPTQAEAETLDVTRPPWLWEWTADVEQGRRVVRGGSWYDDESVLRTAVRYDVDPAFRDYYFFGFRCARCGAAGDAYTAKREAVIREAREETRLESEAANAVDDTARLVLDNHRRARRAAVAALDAAEKGETK